MSAGVTPAATEPATTELERVASVRIKTDRRGRVVDLDIARRFTLGPHAAGAAL
jgi:hypothetical protein